MGVPVAGVGLAGYLFFTMISGVMLAGNDLKGLALPLLLAAAGFAFLYSAYLTYIELFILKAVCPMCVISMTLVTLIAVVAFMGTFSARKEAAA